MNQLQFKTVIFDLDGTLIDTLTDIAQAANQALEEQGFLPHHHDRYQYFVGEGLLVLAQKIVPAGTPENVIRVVVARFRDIYMDCWDRNSRPYPGILEMLESLRRQPVNLAVLSNKPDDFTQLFVARFFAEDTFGQVMGNQQGLPKKPDPTAARVIAEYFGTPPGSCLLVGDSSVDMKTGKAAGMTSLGVSWGFRGRQELIDNGADFIVDHPSEITSHVILDY